MSTPRGQMHNLDAITMLAEAAAESTDDSKTFSTLGKNEVEVDADADEDEDVDGEEYSWERDGEPRSPAPRASAASTPGAKTASRGSWTAEEDEKLKHAVSEYGGRNWKKIAEQIPDRTDVQCLHRWQKVLRPGLIKGPWTSEV